MREIEIKARVADKSKLLDVLKTQNVTLSSPIIQHDRVWGMAGVEGDSSNSSPWLRIRSETKDGATKQLFTLKKSVTNQMDSIEHETEIADEAEMAHIITHLGFAPYSDVKKTRQKAKLDGIELCIDSVEDLGDFVEVEKLTDEDANYDEVAEELWAVLERFGVGRDAYVTNGYDVMMRKSKGLKA